MGIPNAHGELWLRPYGQVARPRLRLICFPHAGGSASTFRAWAQHLPRDVEVLAACYPGREGRLAERPIDRMDLLVEPLVEAVLPLLDRPVAFFGHSMGASVAYEVTRRLEGLPDAVIVALFVSGRMAPHRLREARTPQFADDAALIEEIRRLGHGTAEVFDDPEFLELILPAIRADYRLVATYRPSADEALSTPVVAYGGAEDPEVSVQDIYGWSKATTGKFGCRVFPGGHFYLEPQERQLVRDVADRLVMLGPTRVS